MGDKKAPGRGAPSAYQASGEDSKKAKDIVAWVRSLPEAHVPERSREQIAGIIESQDLGEAAFTEYIQTVPPDICAPKNKMKLKNAWDNVLKESALRKVACENFNSAPKQK